MVKNRRFEKETSSAIFGIRHLQCLLLFCGLGVGYAMRVNLSVAIVAMTDRNATNPDFPEFNWSEQTKSLLLSSFFWGYVVTQIPGGQLARLFGGKIILLYGNLVSAVLAVLTPMFTEFGNWQLLFAVRIIQGLSQGSFFPCTHTILSKWAPVEERGPLVTYCYAGTLFGAVIMFASSGVLASSSLGWPSIFYVSGGLGFVWVGAWIVWGADTPNDYKSISVEEKKLIETSLGQSAANEESKVPMQTPWKKIITSIPFLVLCVPHSAHNWGFWTLLTQLPSYMKHVLGMDIKSNAFFSALPYLAMVLLSFVFCSISNYLVRNNWIGISTSRKLFNSIGQWTPAVTLIALSYVDAEHTTLAVSLLIITVGLNAASFLGFQVNHIDLSPNFAGVLMGIANCGANVMSVLAPLVVGFVVTDVESPEQWRIIFFIAGGFYFFGNLLFVIFGSTAVQPWNDPMMPPAQELKVIMIERSLKDAQY